jgi:hypothetical protein
MRERATQNPLSLRERAGVRGELEAAAVLPETIAVEGR